MKRILLGSTALIGLAATSAMAADLPVKAPVYKAPPPVAIYSWTGCYLGGHAGWGWGRKHARFSDTFDVFPIIPFSEHVDGFLGGVQGGCDYQFNTNWVVGVEGAFSWADIKGHALNDPFVRGKGSSGTFSARTDWLATLTGRLGYAWDRWLVYGKGGVAWAHDKYRLVGLGDNVFGPFALSATETRTGWTAGGGVEYAFLNNWSAKLEYNYMDFGSHRLRLAGLFVSSPVFATTDIDQKIHVVKFGINYRFGVSPVVARY